MEKTYFSKEERNESIRLDIEFYKLLLELIEVKKALREKLSQEGITQANLLNILDDDKEI